MFPKSDNVLQCPVTDAEYSQGLKRGCATANQPFAYYCAGPENLTPDDREPQPPSSVCPWNHIVKQVFCCDRASPGWERLGASLPVSAQPYRLLLFLNRSRIPRRRHPPLCSPILMHSSVLFRIDECSLLRAEQQPCGCALYYRRLLGKKQLRCLLTYRQSLL